MHLDLPLRRGEDAERLRTAVYRFAELKSWAPPPVEVRACAGRLHGLVVFRSEAAADEFRRYWAAFGADRRDWSGFRDV